MLAIIKEGRGIRLFLKFGRQIWIETCKDWPSSRDVDTYIDFKDCHTYKVGRMTDKEVCLIHPVDGNYSAVFQRENVYLYEGGRFSIGNDVRVEAFSLN